MKALLGLTSIFVGAVVLGACTAPVRSVEPGSSSTLPSMPTTSPSLPSSTDTTTATAAATPCHNDQIAVADGGGGAGLGHEDQVLLFKNETSTPCSLTGYPGVAGLDSDGQQVVQAQRTLSGYLGGLWNNALAPPTVSLQPGQTGSAIVEGTDVNVGTEVCPYYSKLLVTPPGLTESTPVTVRGLGSPPYQGLPGCSPIEVHPVVPGSTGILQ